MHWKPAVLLHDLGDRLTFVSHNDSNRLLYNFMLNEEKFEDNESIELEENTVLKVDKLTYVDNDDVRLRQQDHPSTAHNQSPRVNREELSQSPNSDENDKLSDDHTLEVQSTIKQVRSDPDVKIMKVDESAKRISQNTIYTDGLKCQGVYKDIFLYRKGKFIMYKIISLHYSKSHNDSVIKSIIEALKLIGTNMYLKEFINCLSTPSSYICKKLE
uniref:Copia protein n=1 Tax=Strongyloides venezuelensis TaxID=75913 RepID=A0A0K0FTH7_STRVS